MTSTAMETVPWVIKAPGGTTFVSGPIWMVEECPGTTGKTGWRDPRWRYVRKIFERYLALCIKRSVCLWEVLKLYQWRGLDMLYSIVQELYQKNVLENVILNCKGKKRRNKIRITNLTLFHCIKWETDCIFTCQYSRYYLFPFLPPVMFSPAPNYLNTWNRLSVTWLCPSVVTRRFEVVPYSFSVCSLVEPIKVCLRLCFFAFLKVLTFESVLQHIMHYNGIWSF